MILDILTGSVFCFGFRAYFVDGWGTLAAPPFVAQYNCNVFPLYHSTSRITLRRFMRSRACTTSLLSSTASRRSTVCFASPRYSPKMRLASSTARMMVSWSGLFMTVRQLHEIGNQDGGRISFPFGAAVLCLGG